MKNPAQRAGNNSRLQELRRKNDQPSEHSGDGEKNAALIVPTNERFDRIRRALLIFCSTSILISISAGQNVGIIFTSQSASMPLWTAMSLVLIVVPYYLLAFEHERSVIEIHEKGSGLKLNLEQQIENLIQRVNNDMNSYVSFDYKSMGPILSPAYSLKKMLEEGELEKMVLHHIKDRETVMDLMDVGNRAEAWKRIESRLSQAIALDIRAHSKNIILDTEELPAQINDEIRKMVTQVELILPKLARAQKSFRRIDRQINRISPNFSKSARLYFDWWEILVPRLIAIIAILMAVYNMWAQLNGSAILSEILALPNQREG